MKWLIRSILVLVLAGGIYFLIAPNLATEVVVSQSKRGTAINAVPGNVEVYTGLTTSIRCEVNGRVQEVIKPPNSEARQIKKGTPIVILDTTEIDNTIAIVEADLKEGQRLLAQESQYVPIIEGIRDELQDQEELLAAGRIAEADVDRTRQNLRRHENLLNSERIRLERLVERNQALLNTHLLNREKHTITATVDGTLDATFVFVGDYIRVNHRVAEIASNSMRVIVDVSEEDLDGLKKEQPVTVRLLAYGNQLFQGTVSWLAFKADPNTKRRSIRVNLDIPRDMLVAGLTGQATIVKGERENAILVPRRALVGRNLMVVRDGRVEVREVTIGYLGIGQAEILEGLENDELVIVETPHIYEDGQRVKVDQVVPF